MKVTLVPDFAAVIVSSNEQAIQLSKLVLATKPGAGAVIGGRASELATVADQETLTNQALIKTAGITAATTDILKYVVMQVDRKPASDTAVFTRDIAMGNGSANIPLAAKIGTGGVAGDPTNGGNIVNTLLNEVSLAKLKSGAASFIKSVAKVADIEEISRIAAAVGNQISVVSPTNSATTAIKVSAANGIVKSLAKAIIAKATTTNDIADVNSWDNKEDEVAEVAAYMVGKILNPLTIQGTPGGKPQLTIKNAKSKIFAIVMSAVNATKGAKIAASAPTIYNETAVDVAGSVAETLSSLRFNNPTIASEFFDTIKAFLIQKAAVIGGKANAALVTAAINDAYEQTGPSLVDIHFEDGTKNSAFPVEGPLVAGALPDRDETDVRPN
jgi:hypothetical protein